MTPEEYAAKGQELSREADVLSGLHSYFVLSCERLHKTATHFKLFEKSLGDVLEIGAFFGYTPFFLKPSAKSYVVLEGDDPAVYPLKPLYAKRNIEIQFVDLFEMFGPTHHASHTLPYKDGSFDTILCWETMEHFNFNPAKFVREIYRVLKPGGRVYVTVPNKASFQNLTELVLGRRDRENVQAYYTFENYTSNGKKAFYGFHWREYTQPEMAHLFSMADFRIEECGTFVAFQGHAQVSTARRVVRGVNSVVGGLMRRFGTNVYLVAQK